MSRAWVRLPTTVRVAGATIGVALLLSLLVACGGSSDGGTLNPTHKTVFLSSASYDGNLGGLSGADAKCQSLANAAQLGGTFRAWLTGSTAESTSRLTAYNVPYRLVDGTTVGDNFTDLSDYALHQPLNVDENGVNQGNYEAWTGVSGDHCSDWTTNDSGVTGYVGVAGSTGVSWLYAYSQHCSRTNVKLYCIEQ